MKKSSISLSQAHLKLELLRTGIRVAEPLNSLPFFDIIFPEGLRASMAEADVNGPSSGLELVQEQEFSYLVSPGGRIHVEVRPNPDFYNCRTSTGKAFKEIAALRANYVQVLPSALGKNVGATPNEVLEVVQKSLGGGWAEYVSFHVLPSKETDQLSTVLPYVEAVKRHVDTHVSLTIQSPKDETAIHQSYAAGVDAIAYITADLEEPSSSEAEHCFKSLSYAANIFPTGGVVALLLLRRGRGKEIMQDIERLTGKGIFPILAYRSSFGKRVEDPMEIAEAAKLFRYVDLQIRRRKFKLGWVPHVEAVTQSVDPGYFARFGSRKFVRGIMRTFVGSRLVFSMNAVRRKLRVQEK